MVKWQFIVSGFMAFNYPYEVRILRNSCGFCQRHTMSNGQVDCDSCEFARVAGKCFEDGSMYDNWRCDKTKENAIRILGAISTMNTTETELYPEFNENFIG